MRTHFLTAAALSLALSAAAAEDVAEARIAGDRFVAGGSVNHAKPAEGDLVGLAGSLDLRASVGGDAILAGGDLRVRESVAHNVFATGGNVRLDGSVGRSARLAGGNVTIAREASIGGNLSVAGGTVEIRGPVAGAIQAAGGDVVIDSTVGGDVHVAAGQLELGPNARIEGRLKYHGPDRMRIDPAARVSGGVSRIERSPMRDRSWRVGGPGAWVWTLGLVALAAFVAAAFPAGSRRMGESLRADPAMALVLGFITLVCVPVAAILLMVTIIGIPLAIVLMLLYFLVLLVGYAAVAVVIGDAALARFRAADATRTGWRASSAMAAMAALALLTSIPYLGKLALFAVLLAGVGTMVLAVRAHREAGRPGAHAA